MKRWLLCLGMIAGCAPAVKLFEVKPIPANERAGARSSSGVVEICAGEAVQAQWQLRGSPAMVLRIGNPRYATRDEDEEEADPLAPDTLELTLVASPGPKEALRTTLVLQYPDSSSDVVGFRTTLRGDTLVAGGVRDTIGAARFHVASISNPQQRVLEVRHAGRSARLIAGASSSDLAGTALGGRWEIRSLMTQPERGTPSLRPVSLQLDVAITCTPDRP